MFGRQIKQSDHFISGEIVGPRSKNRPPYRPPKTTKPRNIMCYKALIFVLAVRTVFLISFLAFFQTLLFLTVIN